MDVVTNDPMYDKNDSGQQVPAAVLLNWSSFSPPLMRPNADCPKEQRLCNRGELPHRTSRQKTCQYVPAGHLVPVWPGARCRPPIFPCAGSAADAPAPGEPGFVCAGDPLFARVPIGRCVRSWGTHIGITSRPAITEIDIFALGTAVTAIDCAGGAKRGVSMAIRALDSFCFVIKSSPPNAYR